MLPSFMQCFLIQRVPLFFSCSSLALSLGCVLLIASFAGGRACEVVNRRWVADDSSCCAGEKLVISDPSLRHPPRMHLHLYRVPYPTFDCILHIQWTTSNVRVLWYMEHMGQSQGRGPSSHADRRSLLRPSVLPISPDEQTIVRTLPTRCSHTANL